MARIVAIFELPKCKGANQNDMISFIQDYIWLILFFIWGLPLGIYRSRFRKLVYQTDSWVINIKPVFVAEVKALFGNLYPDDSHYLRVRNFYRFYLIIYAALFGASQMFQ